VRSTGTTLLVVFVVTATKLEKLRADESAAIRKRPACEGMHSPRARKGAGW